jgi:hypothetical protein
MIWNEVIITLLRINQVSIEQIMIRKNACKVIMQHYITWKKEIITLMQLGNIVPSKTL